MYFEYESEYQRVIHLRHARSLRLLQNTAYQVVKGHILQSKSVCFVLQYVPFRNWSVFVSSSLYGKVTYSLVALMAIETNTIKIKTRNTLEHFWFYLYYLFFNLASDSFSIAIFSLESCCFFLSNATTASGA